MASDDKEIAQSAETIEVSQYNIYYHETKLQKFKYRFWFLYTVILAFAIVPTKPAVLDTWAGQPCKWFFCFFVYDKQFETTQQNASYLFSC